MQQRAARLKDIDVDVLICGAISQALSLMISGSGIEVFSDVSGSIDEILKGYLQGRLTEKRFLMPGCQARNKRGFRCGHGQRASGRGRGQTRRFMGQRKAE